MIDIKPFRGFRYHCASSGDLGRFISPPYDMLPAEAIAALHAADPHNVVRIIQNRAQPGDASNRDRHARAAALLKEWIAQGVVTRESAPSLYVYRHRFEASGASVERTSIIALVKLTEFGSGPIHPHENTLSAPKQDRFDHMEAVKGNTEIVFGLVTDEGEVYRSMTACIRGKPLGQCVDNDNVTHELFAVSDARLIDAVSRAVADREIIIGDGHHRYETAVRFAKEHRIPGSDYVMMSLVSMRDPGLVIRPFHRVIRRQDAVTVADMPARCAGIYDVRDIGAASEQTAVDFVAGQGDGDLLFTSSATRRSYLLKVNASGERLLAALGNGMSPAWNHLNVSLINSTVVGSILGLPLDGKTLHDVVEYEKSPAAALALGSDPAGFYGCFFVRPISIESVRSIVAGGERMPQKSTNFFPKFYSGLVFNLMETP